MCRLLTAASPDFKAHQHVCASHRCHGPHRLCWTRNTAQMDSDTLHIAREYVGLWQNSERPPSSATVGKPPAITGSSLVWVLSRTVNIARADCWLLPLSFIARFMQLHARKSCVLNCVEDACISDESESFFFACNYNYCTKIASRGRSLRRYESRYEIILTKPNQ